MPDCPKCGHQQAAGRACEACGIVFAKFGEREKERETRREVDEDPTLQHLLAGRRIEVEQEMREFSLSRPLADWAQEASYSLTNDQGRIVGWAQVQGRGFFAMLGRDLFGSRKVFVFSSNESVLLEIERGPAWLFAETTVRTPAGVLLGRVKSTHFVIFSSYELHDERGIRFATIRSPLMRALRFLPAKGTAMERYAIRGLSGAEQGTIVRKWAGDRKEAYSNADDFEIDFGARSYTLAQRAVVLAALFNIDFDHHEASGAPSAGGLLSD